jgi:hypothetical protein
MVKFFHLRKKHLNKLNNNEIVDDVCNDALVQLKCALSPINMPHQLCQAKTWVNILCWRPSISKLKHFNRICSPVPSKYNGNANEFHFWTVFLYPSTISCVHKIFVTFTQNMLGTCDILHAYQHMILADLIMFVTCQHHIIRRVKLSNDDSMIAMTKKSYARY